jgi:DNA-binding CsgD family transcriptional regulator/PAS domain-containing protein
MIDLIDAIYAAVLDSNFWPAVLSKLASTTGAGQAVIATLDQRTGSFSSIQKSAHPGLLESYNTYWAFHNPLWTRATAFPAGQLFTLDTLMPRRDFIKEPIFGQWWVPARYSFAMLGANLHIDDKVSSLVCVINAQGNDTVRPEQSRAFELAARHLARAARIRRQLWTRSLLRGPMPELFDSLQKPVVLVDAEAKVLFANSAAQAILQSGDGVIYRSGYLAAADGTDGLRRLVATCARAIGPLRGPLGGELQVRRSAPRCPLRLSIAPLRPKDPAADIPWLGLRAPVAIVTIEDAESARRDMVQTLRSRFGLTAAEAALAAEIVKGDGRAAAAQRRGISIATARSQLSSIFEKTGTSRQAELVRLLLDLPDKSANKGMEERVL